MVVKSRIKKIPSDSNYVRIVTTKGPRVILEFKRKKYGQELLRIILHKQFIIGHL